MASPLEPAVDRAGGLTVLGVGVGPEISGTGADDGASTGGDDLAARDRDRAVRDRDALAVLLSVHGLGPLTLGRLVEVAGSASAVLALASEPGAASRLVEASRVRDSDGHAMPRSVADGIVLATGKAESIVREVARLGIRVVAAADAEYPRRLRAIDAAPPALFVLGTLDALSAQNVVAVVGTRRPSPAGRRIASRVAASLTRAGATVVSGLAIGIDGASHAAVVAERGRTVAFIGGGHARLFPRAHERLADAIVAAGGAVVSEYAPTTPPSKGTFPQRNRLISGASDAVVVIEAGARSGALVTASWALEQGRECFLVPGSIDAPASAGCNGFLRDWPDLARIVSGIPQLLDDLGLSGAAGLPVEARPPDPEAAARDVPIRSTVKLPSASAVLSGSSPADRAVAEALVRGAVTVDELVAVTRLSVGAVLGVLTRLEALGLVVATHGRYEPAGPLAAASPRAA